MRALDWLWSLRPALPMSVEQKCGHMSRSELRRCIDQGSVLINAQRVSSVEEIDFPVFSLVFFPRSTKRRTTLI